MDNATEDRRPLWQMDVRQRLGLEPGKHGPIEQLLYATIYSPSVGSRSDVAEKIKTHIVELQAAVKMLEGA